MLSEVAIFLTIICDVVASYYHPYIQKIYHVNHTEDTLLTARNPPSTSFHLNMTYNFRNLSLRLYGHNHEDALLTPFLSSYSNHSLLTGYVEGDYTSSVYGYFTVGGYFVGVVYTPTDTIHIEPSQRFGFTHSHNVIYHKSDVDYKLVYQHFKSATPNHTPPLPNATLLASYNLPTDAIQGDGNPYAPQDEKIFSFSKRSAGRLPRFKKTCPVYLVSDHLFYRKMGGSDEEKTKNELILHLHEADKIFRSTDFDDDGTNDNIGFSVANISILKENTAENKFSDNIIAVKEFLDRWSEYNHDAYCLAVLFTYRDFDSGVLGLAWVASVDGAPGGICQKRQVVGGYNRNLNTAIVSLINFGRYVGHDVSFITVAHELGHNFGSSHDKDNRVCSPGSKSEGNYIMYARATDGNLPNNVKFSTCSKESITSVLSVKSSSCFKTETSYCGNKIKEWDEVCDCGNKDTCIDSKCCQAGCILRSSSRYDYQCSGQEGPCCDEARCQFRNVNVRCDNGSSCTEQSYCNGTTSVCPLPPHKGKNILCNGGQNTCNKGKCTGSICQLVNLQECQCETDSLCTVCCLEEGRCVPTGSTSVPTNLTYLVSGRSCNNYQGYCNANHECIQVNLENPLTTLEDVFSKRNLGNALQWLQKHWYYTITILGCVILLCILLKVTYRRSEPIKKYVQQVSRTLRRGGGIRNINYQQYIQQPQQVMSDADKEKLRRMCLLFPTATKSVAWSVRSEADTEEVAVINMLDLGYPLKPNSL